MANKTITGKYIHRGNKPDGEAEQIVNTKHTIVADKLDIDPGFTTTVISSGQIKKRGRPKGSKNKKPATIETDIEQITEHGYTYKASCGCLFITAIKTRLAQYCKHGNLMSIADQADFTR